jgi:predicted nuclease of predicted toxin-antitoxin system
MRRMLIDECLPVQLHRALAGFDARTVSFMGWSSWSDAEILRASSEQFDILLTGDRALPFENDLASLSLAVVVIAETRRRLVVAKIQTIAAALHAACPGTLTFLS